MNKVLAISLVAILVIGLITAVPLTHTFAKSGKEKKILKSIGKALDRATEGKPSTIDMLNISKFNDSSTIVVINKTGGPVVPLPPPNPPPNPPPTPVPTGNISKVCLVGDLKAGSSTVPNMMKNGGCNLKIGLGDLGYASDLSYFKGLKFDKCVIGNHDATEDGSSTLYKEALAYCNDGWWLTIASGNVLIIGVNTNGDTAKQVSTVKLAMSQQPQVSTIILVSHKAGHIPPNSHHPAEAAALYKQLEALIPTNVKLFEIYGHNHVNSAAHSMNWYQAGTGGKSFYSCGTDNIWTFCDNTHNGYLELTIDNTNGTTAAKFIK